METLSFILGIAFVVVIVIAIVAVYAFVKVRQLKEELNDRHRDINVNISEVYRRIDETGEMVSRVLDSRLDKLENKLINKK
jgi:predicted Holliday junction resolvase-like endonuclease